ncbi:peptidase M35 [Massilia arenosa]|uniref:Peptidase M35 n=1 Tax=Zemynaea arenosa TaxID=2561931 RepID=A0A4Y9SXH9_9BURK|nr:M35 family metallo-endopeptidase [Massilia arenosa]TFW29924.1 peptidase M35 [Massilia arenosa]
MNWNHVVKAGAVLAIASACTAAQAASGIAVSIAPMKSHLKASDDVVVKVTMTNTSGQPQLVLKWQTPFGEEIEEALFEVTRDGVRVPYRGAHYKRPAPTAGDYYLLKPGASYSAKVELSALYDMSVTGDYQVRYHARGMNLIGGAAERGVNEIASDAVSLWIDGVHPRGTVLPEPMSLADLKAPGGSGGGTGGVAGLAFNKCTTSQQADITNARAAALSMATDGSNYLASSKQGQRYTKWFGTYDAGRYATVTQHFAAIKDAFANKPITVDCGCKKTYYAYVYPTQPYTIYVCKAFWSAPMTGTDSKGGTLVHEMSHFNVVAGTDDWVYGQSGAANLAISDPAKAIDNADSHEYFGENTPALP